MNKKGFTLVETMMGLFLLGLIAVTVLPTINSSFMKFRNQKTKMEMMYIGEMAIERIKGFSEDNTSNISIFDRDVSEIIELFRTHSFIEIDIPEETYSLKITKNQKSDSLWMVSVFVYHNIEGSSIGHVEYKAYLPQK